MHPVWQLIVNYAGITAAGTINGFPILDVASADDGASGFAGVPLNPYLIGRGNRLRIEVTGRRPGATLACSIQCLGRDDVVDTGTAEPVALPDGAPPHVIERTFDSEEAGFAALLAQARPTTAEVVTAFALRLRDTLNAGDSEGAWTCFRPKFEAIAAAIGQPLSAIEGQVRAMLAMLAGARHAFDAADVVAQPICDAKLWRLRHRDGGELLRVRQDDGTVTVDCCVAALAGGVAVVR